MSYLTTQTSSKCNLCEDLLPDGPVKRTPIKPWLSALVASPCTCCQILVQCFRGLRPDLLEDRWRQQHRNDYIRIYRDSTFKLIVAVSEGDRGAFGEKDLEVFSTESDPALRFLTTGRDIDRFPGERPTWDFIQTRLDDCLRHHDVCRSVGNNEWYPKRLLHVVRSVMSPQRKSFFSRQEKQADVMVRLVSSLKHKVNGPYIALSHCWGGYSGMKLLKKDISKFEKGIEFEKMPHVFRDMITVALESNVDYVWIDALCIVQDRVSEWAENSRNMHEIYENALFTVASVASSDDSIPFLGPAASSKRSAYMSVDITAPSLVGDRSIIRARQSAGSLYPGHLAGPLQNRAWAFQERYLSTRVVAFTQEEIKWACYESTSCECGSSDPSGYLKSIPKEREHSHKAWKRLVSAYSSRKTTYPSDRLPALSGCASRFNKHMQTNYLAGLWESDFPTCLTWWTPPDPLKQAHQDTGAPSWSWASTTKTVAWAWGLDADDASPAPEQLSTWNHCRLVGSGCQPRAPENEYGEVGLGSYIDVECQTIEAMLEVNSYGWACVRRETIYAVDHLVEDPEEVLLDHVFVPEPVGGGGTDAEAGAVRWRRAARSEELQQQEQQQRQQQQHIFPTQDIAGPVTCVLLQTIKAKDSGHVEACVLILAPPVGTVGAYRRLGIGFNCEGYARTDGMYAKQNIDGCHRGRWFDWEGWFGDADTQTIRII